MKLCIVGKTETKLYSGLFKDDNGEIQFRPLIAGNPEDEIFLFKIEDARPSWGGAMAFHNTYVIESKKVSSSNLSKEEALSWGA